MGAASRSNPEKLRAWRAELERGGAEPFGLVELPTGLSHAFTERGIHSVGEAMIQGRHPYNVPEAFFMGPNDRLHFRLTPAHVAYFRQMNIRFEIQRTVGSGGVMEYYAGGDELLQNFQQVMQMAEPEKQRFREKLVSALLFPQKVLMGGFRRLRGVGRGQGTGTTVWPDGAVYTDYADGDDGDDEYHESGRAAVGVGLASPAAGAGPPQMGQMSAQMSMVYRRGHINLNKNARRAEAQASRAVRKAGKSRRKKGMRGRMMSDLMRSPVVRRMEGSSAARGTREPADGVEEGDEGDGGEWKDLD